MDFLRRGRPGHDDSRVIRNARHSSVGINAWFSFLCTESQCYLVSSEILHHPHVLVIGCSHDGKVTTIRRG
jgi:hypothetical protein